MLAKSSFVKLMIAALIIVPGCNSSTSEEIRNIFIDAKFYKHPRCFPPNRLKCGGSVYPEPDMVIVKWVFDALAKACIPFYMPPEQKDFCPSFFNLPQTKKECEDMCGEPCVITYPNYVTEPGICMLDCHIPISQGVPQPCPPNHTRCCPRNYISPTSEGLTTEPTTTFRTDTVIMTIDLQSRNNSSVSNSTTDLSAP